MSDLKNKIALITGATGLIGSNLVDKLIKAGTKVIVIGRSEKKITEVFEEHLMESNFSYEVVDISKGIPPKVGYVDYIFHAASPISSVEIKNNPVDVIEANLLGAKNCLEFLKEQKERKDVSGRMIVFSSATVYGSKPAQNKSVLESETHRADALDLGSAPYSEAKRMVEVIARSYYIQYKVESIIARIGYVYGYTKNSPDTAFYGFINKAVNGEDIIVNNSGLGRRDNIFVDDVVNGLLTVALRGNPGEAYNISSNGEKDNFRAIDEIAQIIVNMSNELREGRKIQIYMKQNGNGRAPGLMLDNNKLKKLGWFVETGMQEGIKETVNRYMGRGQ